MVGQLILRPAAGLLKEKGSGRDVIGRRATAISMSFHDPGLTDDRTACHFFSFLRSDQKIRLTVIACEGCRSTSKEDRNGP
jgi:hypothetical protein